MVSSSYNSAEHNAHWWTTTIRDSGILAKVFQQKRSQMRNEQSSCWSKTLGVRLELNAFSPNPMQDREENSAHS